MSLKINEKNENKLLKRVEVKAELEFTEKATPSNEDVTKMVAKELKATPELVVVKQIATRYGNASADVTAYVYSSKGDKESIEAKTKFMREKEKAAAKPAEKKVEDKPAEKPAEAKKEEKAEG